MTFLYCYSCGYRKAFEDYVNILADKYPQITVTGGNYDPPGMNMYFSKLIFAVKILLIVVIVSSFDIFGSFGQPTPSWWRHLLENKLYACMMIFFVGNMLEGQLVSSGAFEISLNDVPVWSKLQTGRIPAPQELFQIIDNQLQFGDKFQENPDFVK
ncbi:thioredoxin reductase-like selenoprotein T homolog CG3887 [Musca vetustissima]|uniref:thioredoxin reductase-like selenoprotein T homolog CG3887 n=1 Tax=Musca vetustissima TaxID=27455 RepID=UPI002AB63161|nr:thioredoxin reductase-like selenoprotein T homolog CG3887 [Musca vetustissima]